jgi:hypothetical protein
VYTDAEIRHRSPAVWGLMGAGLAAVVVLGYTVAVNAYDHRADIIRWLKL